MIKGFDFNQYFNTHIYGASRTISGFIIDAAGTIPKEGFTFEYIEDFKITILESDMKRVELLELLRQTIRPEFLNRIDEVILFKPLTMSEIREIVRLQLKAVQSLAAQNAVVLECSDELQEWIAKVGYDPLFGARPLKRVIQKYVTNPLAERILDRSIGEGDTVEVGLDRRGMVEFVTRGRTNAPS